MRPRRGSACRAYRPVPEGDSGRTKACPRLRCDGDVTRLDAALVLHHLGDDGRHAADVFERFFEIGIRVFLVDRGFWSMAHDCLRSLSRATTIAAVSLASAALSSSIWTAACSRTPLSRLLT